MTMLDDDIGFFTTTCAPPINIRFQQTVLIVDLSLKLNFLLYSLLPDILSKILKKSNQKYKSEEYPDQSIKKPSEES